ncbi:MAG: Ribosomal RNA large subunit methyltransferase H [Prosthecobacter sp.]|nr:Ribosomal RNA large subunit methyltransferase H [Prosthecobacter sp.]
MEDYLARLQRVAKFEHVVVKEGPQEVVEQAMMSASQGGLRIVLDERGKMRRSLELAQWVEDKQIRGVKRINLMIGGANGHSKQIRAAADECWSLSTFTLQHEIALVVLAEQIYRSYSILRKEPYHRE